MAIITIDGPGGERSVQVDNPDLLAELIAKNADQVVSVETDSPDGSDSTDLTRRTSAELRDLAADLGIDVPKGTKKAALAALVAKHRAANDPDGDED